MKKLSFKTKDGCVRILLICLCIVLIFSCIAQGISSNGASIKIEEISIDARGAVLQGDLYYPAGVTDRSKLPAIVFAHGAGVTKENYRGITEELARRGFVVFSINGYATGESELPVYDESGMGVEMYDTFSSSSGTLDALNFVRNLKFVDPTRLGLAGHSQGSRRMEICANLDCGYYTLNDIMLNVLTDDFGLALTEEDIEKNADDIAKDQLAADDLKVYEYMKAEKTEYYNTRAKALCLIGSNAQNSKALREVMVAGYPVMRNIQINRAIVNGLYDSTGFYLQPDYSEAYYITEDIQPEVFYSVSDATKSCEVVGDFPSNILDNAKLQEAFDNRSVRLVAVNVESHSKNFLSEQTASDIVKYFEEALMYNNGELGAATTQPIDAYESHFVGREICNAIAMFAMLTMLLPLAKLLLGTKFFASCEGVEKVEAPAPSKKRYWIANIAAVVIGIIATLCLDKLAEQPWMYFHATPAFPLFFSWWMTPIFLGVLAVLTLILVIVLAATDKKKNGASPIANTNIKMNVVSVLKSILLALILIITAYATLALIKYLFNQDFRLWMFALPPIKVEHWGVLLKTALFFFPQLLIIALGINYCPNKNLPGWLDDLLCVIFNSLGVWLVCLIDALTMGKNGCKWTFTYGYIFSVPILTYMSRRLFKQTKNVWIGAAFGALLLAWLLTATMGYDIYIPQAFGNIFFNA